MRCLLIIVGMLMMFACSQDCRITDQNGSDNIPLIEGEYYCLSRDSVCTYALGEYQLIDGVVTFSENISGISYRIVKLARPDSTDVDGTAVEGR